MKDKASAFYTGQSGAISYYLPGSCCRWKGLETGFGNGRRWRYDDGLGLAASGPVGDRSSGTSWTALRTCLEILRVAEPLQSIVCLDRRGEEAGHGSLRRMKGRKS